MSRVQLAEWTETDSCKKKKSVQRSNSFSLFVLQKMLTFDPAKRISALNALEHPYFQN